MLRINRLVANFYLFVYIIFEIHLNYIFIFLAIYIAISIYFGINDGQIAIAFVLCFIMLILLAIDLNDKFKQEFNRYKKYLKIKKNKII